MLDRFQVVFAGVWQSELGSIIAISCLVALLLLIMRPLIARWLKEFRIQQAIRKLGKKSISKLVVPDGIDGNLLIEHLVLTSDTIMVVSVKRYDGLIYGGRSTEMWTQVVKGRNYPFSNPLEELNGPVSALQLLLPGVPIKGITVFAGGGTFPKGPPQGVLTLADLKVESNATTMPATLTAGWQTLNTIKSNQRQAIVKKSAPIKRAASK